MLIRNLTLFLFFCFFSYNLGNSTFVKSMVECSIKHIIHTITSRYYSIKAILNPLYRVSYLLMSCICVMYICELLD